EGAEFSLSASSAAPAHAEPLEAHTEARSFVSRGAAESAEEVAGPGCVHRGAGRSSPGSMFMMNVVSSGGILAHPAGEPAGRGRLHPANADPPGANHHIKGSLNRPRSLRSAKEPRRRPQLRALCASA